MKNNDERIKNGVLKEHHLVTQSNRIIEAVYQMDLISKKLMMSIISQVEPKDDDFDYYLISVDDWKKLAEIRGRTDYFQILLRSARKLRAKDISIFESGNEINVGLVSAIKHDQKENTIGIRFDKELKPYLIGLKGNFTQYKINNIMRMRSVYSIRLYELLKRRENIATWSTKLDDLKPKLGITGSKFSAFSNFRMRVIDAAKKELSQKTDIGFNYDALKTGRKVTGIKFHIYKVIQEEEKQSKIIKDILSIIPEIQRKSCEDISKKILNECGEECLKWIVKYIGEKDHKNYGGYIRFVYDNKLYEQFLEQKKLEERYLEEQETIAQDKKKEQIKKDNACQKAINRKDYLNELMNSLSPKEREELNQLALEILENKALTDKGAKWLLARYEHFIHLGKYEKAANCLYNDCLSLVEEFKTKKESALTV